MDTDGIEPPRRQENERMKPQVNADGRGGGNHGWTRMDTDWRKRLATKMHKRGILKFF
jgi:hypothetical protein